MINTAGEWNPMQEKLRMLLSDPKCFDAAIALFYDMHAVLLSFDERLWENLDEKIFRNGKSVKGTTIAWNVWHISRIEDITTNILIANRAQVFESGDWSTRMKTNVKDTGNAMTDEEISAFSQQVDMYELHKYRTAVGSSTLEVIKNLREADLKRKMNSASIKSIFEQGGLLKGVPDSEWLADFWGRKTVAGLILMPLTRHQVGHLNDSLKIKAKYQKEKDKYNAQI